MTVQNLLNKDVQIKGIKSKDLKFLNGLTGKVTLPFAGSIKKNWIGIILADNNLQYNIKISECKPI